MKTNSWWLAAFALAACGDQSSLQSTSDVPSPALALDAGSSRQTADEPKVDAGVRTAQPSVPPSKVPSDEPAVCNSFLIRGERVKPDMLIVLDRSGSMREDDVNRWDPSVSGIKSITAALDGVVSFGLMTFPGVANNRDDEESCQVGTVNVPVGPMTSRVIATSLDGMEPRGRTPTAASLAAAHQAISALAKPAADLVSASPGYVILVTDGEPNCGSDGSDGQVQASADAIKAMAQDGIKTYVLGYDTQADDDLKGALDTMAQAGGTGDTAHRPIENEASLIAAFREITARAVSCDFQLNEAPRDASFVLVEVGGKPVSYGEANGWSLSADKLKLTLHGTTCADFAAAATPTLSVTVQCEVVQLI